MPHATGDERMEDIDEDSAVADFLRQQDGVGLGDTSASFEYTFDQANKADDAIDYEDISDEDDLPEEEVATNQAGGGDDVDREYSQLLALGGLPVQPPQPQTNGYHHDAQNQHSGDLFGDGDDTHDLFGEQSSSPEQQRAQPAHHAHPPPQRPGGLALPSKSSLALPGFVPAYQDPRLQASQQSLASMSPASSFHDDGYSEAPSSDSEESELPQNLNPQQRAELERKRMERQQRKMQRDMFKVSARRYAGEDVDEDRNDIDMSLFYTLYPRFEANRPPDFVDLFPPRPGTYRGKVPLKPPRPLQPTKLSLDLLPDQEKSFKAPNNAKVNLEDRSHKNGLVLLTRGRGAQEDSDDDLALSTIDENERIGGVTMQDLAIICGDWDVPSSESDSVVAPQNDMLDGEWEFEERTRPKKKQRTNILDVDFSLSLQDPQLPFEEPERATAKLAKSVALDLNDPMLLIDESLPQRSERVARTGGNLRRDGAAIKSAAKRYNISNDEAYDLLKENHQHKVRSTLGSMAVEHSLPAVKLQYPFYKISLDSKTKRSFHRPHMELKDNMKKNYTFQKMKHVKRKHLRGRDVKDLFAKSEDLFLGDNASVALLEYSEEAPIMMSNFGMGNRLINYYRKRDADDQERPKREIGETHVLLTQDKSPFSQFGHVDSGEIVPTIQNGLYRAPIFQHKAKPTDFLVGVSSTHVNGHKFYLRNVENLHTVGQQFPFAEVPGEHSRKVTDAAKKRLRALSYRIYTKSIDPTRPKAKPLTNDTLMPHLPGHDMPQTRSKMREFMKYERGPGRDGSGVWVPPPNQVVPDTDTIRGWIKPEDICLLDSMQVGVQHLADLGIKDGKDTEEDKDVDEGANIELQLAPWQTTKNFLNACQGKAMLKLHGEGDPTGRGDGFSFVKTSMKGGFQALGESVEDKIEAKKRREAGGHTYNVAKQQNMYSADIAMIWNKQKQSLSAEIEASDTEMEDDQEPQSAFPFARGATPRSSFGTPAFGRRDDESASQFSKGSADRGEKAMIIIRTVHDDYGNAKPIPDKVTNPRVIALYRKRRMEKQLEALNVLDLNPTGDPEADRLRRIKLERELARVSRNVERREAREKAKGKVTNSPAAGAGSPGASEGNSATDATPQKGGRGRNKDGTARKCANCGQVGHIKTNRKSVTFRCLFCECDEFEPKAGDQRSGMSNGGNSTSVASSAANEAKKDSFVNERYSKFTL